MKYGPFVLSNPGPEKEANTSVWLHRGLLSNGGPSAWDGLAMGLGLLLAWIHERVIGTTTVAMRSVSQIDACEPGKRPSFELCFCLYTFHFGL